MSNKAYTSRALLAEMVRSQAYQLEGIAKNGDFLDELIGSMPEDTVTYSTCYPSSIAIYVKGGKDVLTHAIRALRIRGYRSDKVPEEKSPTFDANYAHEEFIGDGFPRVNLNYSSTICKRVKTGSKMVEVDVYEVQCDEPPIGDSVPEEIAEAAIAEAYPTLTQSELQQMGAAMAEDTGGIGDDCTATDEKP